MSHGSVAGVLSLGGKIPANSNSVFTSRQSPFRAPAIARSAFCNSRCWVAEGREEEGILGASGGWVAGEGAFGCGTGGVGAAQDSFADEGSLARSDLCVWQRSFGGRGRPPHIGLLRGRGLGERGRFRLRLRKRCHYTGFFRGRGRPRYASICGGRGLGGRGRPPHIPHIGIFEVGGGPGLIADDPFGDAE